MSDLYNAIPRSTSNLYAAMISFAVMQRPEWDFNGGIDEAEAPWPDSPEERVDRFGLLTAALVLCGAFFIAALCCVCRVFRNAVRWRTQQSAMPATTH
jgi:hypothetical protein